MDIDKDAIHRPPPATRRKRPSAIKCAVVLCSLIGFFVFAVFVWFIGKGFYSVYDNARNPYKDLYLNASTVASGTEAVAWPFIGKEERFDVYFAVWARVPDIEAVGEALDLEEAASRERLGTHLDTVRKMAKVPERELLVYPVERVVFSEKVFENVGLKDQNLHKDISFELPLSRFRDKMIYSGDVRGAAIVVPRSGILRKVTDLSGWRPEGVRSLPRLDDETTLSLGLQVQDQDLLSAVSASFAMIELHDKDEHVNGTAETAGGEEEHEYFKEEGWTGKEGESMNKRYKQWSTWQPHFVTKSHAYILDETRPLNQTLFNEKHEFLKDTSCGQFVMGMSLPGTRWMCSRISLANGLWENRLIVDDDSGEKVMYGPYVNVLRNMKGPKHVMPLPVRRNEPFDPAIDQETVTVHHQFTFSSFGPGRMHMLDNFAPPSEVDRNATDAAKVQAHSDWEQFNGVLGNRAHGTHPRTRFLLAILEDLVLGIPIAILGFLYWYTRQTTAGLHSFGLALVASCTFAEEIHFAYLGARSKTVSWEMYIFALVFSLLSVFEGIIMARLVLPFEVIWGEWLPTGMRRVGWTKRERDTRRLERRVSWVQRGVIFAASGVVLGLIHHYDLFVVNPLHRLPEENTDIKMSAALKAILGAVKVTARVLQLVLNKDGSKFAGQYALRAYMIIAQRVISLLKFWPWFVGRYEVRGGIGWSTVLFLGLEVAELWQAATLPRVEQVVKEDEEDE